MNTAVSLPDELLEQADALALRLGKSRSQLFAEAITEYLARYDADTVTNRMNQVLDSVGERKDSALEAAVLDTLIQVEW